MNRRQFLASTAVAPAFVPASALGQGDRPAASDRVTMGVIGTGNQGTGDMLGFLQDPRVQVVAVCDVNRMTAGYWDGALGGREPAKAHVDWRYAQEKRSGTWKGCTAYEDFRQLLARRDIDAVLIALPDHWHAIPVVEAAKAGKDIYGEKPLSLTIHDGQMMVQAVKKYNRIFQTGSQQRSDARFRKAVELVQSGKLGTVKTVRCGLPGGVPDLAGGSGKRKDPEPVPEGFNYEMWLGPAPKAPYAPARCFVNYRWIFDYSGGMITDWGGHHPDIAQWGLGKDGTGPVEIRNVQGKFAEDKLWNTATEFYYEAVYDDGSTIIVSNKERGGVTFEGTEGKIWVNRGAIEATPKSLLDGADFRRERNWMQNEPHYVNFIDCVLSRKTPNAPIEAAHRSITLAHLANIALRVGRTNLRWDAVKEQIIDDAEANKQLSRPLQNGWKITL